MHLCCIIKMCISIGQSMHKGKNPGAQSTRSFIFHLNCLPSSPVSYSSIPPPRHLSFPPSTSRATQPISRRDPEPFKGQVIQGHWRVRPADWLTSARTSAVSQSHAGVSHSSLPPSLAGPRRRVTWSLTDWSIMMEMINDAFSTCLEWSCPHCTVITHSQAAAA